MSESSPEKLLPDIAELVIALSFHRQHPTGGPWRTLATENSQ